MQVLGTRIQCHTGLSVLELHNGSVAACQNIFLKEPYFSSLSI